MSLGMSMGLNARRSAGDPVAALTSAATEWWEFDNRALVSGAMVGLNGTPAQLGGTTGNDGAADPVYSVDGYTMGTAAFFLMPTGVQPQLGPAESYTIALRVKPQAVPATASAGSYIETRTSGTSDGVVIYARSTEPQTAAFMRSGGSQSTLMSVSGLTTGLTTIFLIIAPSGSTLYVNGTASATVARLAGSSTMTGSWRVGNGPNFTAPNVAVNRLALFPFALTSDQRDTFTNGSI